MPAVWSSSSLVFKLFPKEASLPGGDKERVSRDNKRKKRRVYAVAHNDNLQRDEGKHSLCWWWLPIVGFPKAWWDIRGPNAFNNGSTWEHANLLSSLNCRQTAIATKEKLNYRRWVICNCGSFLCTVTVLSWAKCAGMCLPVALIPCKWKVSCCSCLGWQRASKQHSWRLSTTSHASKRMHWNDSPAPCTLNNKQASSWSL